jgi:hypothetical protein
MGVIVLETDPQDIALADDGDILIDEEGLHFIAGIPAVVQAVRFRLQLFRGEWFMNMDIGVPYLTEILGDASKQPGLIARATAAFAAAILDTPSVISILQLNVSVDPNTRAMTVTWQAQCQFGNTPVDLLEVPTTPGGS